MIPISYWNVLRDEYFADQLIEPRSPVNFFFQCHRANQKKVVTLENLSFAYQIAFFNVSNFQGYESKFLEVFSQKIWNFPYV